MPQAKTLPLILVEEGGLGAAGLDSHQRKWAAANGFTGKLGKLLPLPDAAGNLSGYVFGLGAKTGGPVLATGIAAAMLDPGKYRLEGALGDPTYAALGPDLPPLFSTDDALADALLHEGLASDDPLWRMPLWAPYDKMMESKIADVNNAGSTPFAGSITAAIFLKRFVRNAKAWVHLDIFGWAPEARPGRPFGGTDQGIRSVYRVLKQRYS
jgi:hypothetical protein